MNIGSSQSSATRPAQRAPEGPHLRRRGPPWCGPTGRASPGRTEHPLWVDTWAGWHGDVPDVPGGPDRPSSQGCSCWGPPTADHGTQRLKLSQCQKGGLWHSKVETVTIPKGGFVALRIKNCFNPKRWVVAFKI